MRRPFDGDYPLTQTFGNVLIINDVNIYAQFGMKGHNGLDYGTPTGTKILAPHNGKVIEATLDPKGYGLYIKIENSIEGSVLGHNKELRVGVGDVVDEGQLIAISDNSGNSTGPHLHWGYYRLPRDRNNGYAGFIDQTPYLNSIVPDQALQTCQTQLADEIKKKNDNYNWGLEMSNELDGAKSQILHYTNYEKQLATTLNCEVDEAIILGEITKNINNGDQLRKALADNQILKMSEATLTAQLDQEKGRADNAVTANNACSQSLQEATKEITDLTQELSESTNIYDPILELFGLIICKKRKGG